MILKVSNFNGLDCNFIHECSLKTSYVNIPEIRTNPIANTISMSHLFLKIEDSSKCEHLPGLIVVTFFYHYRFILTSLQCLSFPQAVSELWTELP